VTFTPSRTRPKGAFEYLPDRELVIQTGSLMELADALQEALARCETLTRRQRAGLRAEGRASGPQLFQLRLFQASNALADSAPKLPSWTTNRSGFVRQLFASEHRNQWHFPGRRRKPVDWLRRS
jgi:hypothetical protein